ncbi:hypothetical protein D3C81_2088860 [compost metagenome]
MQLQHRRLVLRQRFTLIFRHRFTDDHLHQIAQGIIGSVAPGNVAAITHDANPIGYFNHLIQTMGDVNHADFFGAQPVDHRKQVAYVVGG